MSTVFAGKSKRKNSCEKNDFFENINKHVPAAIKDCAQCFSLISEKISNHEKKEVRLDELAALIGHMTLWHRQGHLKFD